MARRFLCSMGILLIGAASVSAAQSTSAKLDSSYDMPILVISYFPFNAAGILVDKSVEPTVAAQWPVDRSRASVRDQVKAMMGALERASSYLGYKNPAAKPALRYRLVREWEHLKAVPFGRTIHNGRRYVDYDKILREHDICRFVDGFQGVREVWLFIPSHTDRFDHSESKMAGPHGDISNSYGFNDMPVCASTYRVYTHNYEREDLLAEVWSHQLEAELRAVDAKLFELFQRHCGNAHNPPNARNEYDRNNPTPTQSDCLDWNPDGQGKLSPVGCKLWGCEERGIFDNSVLNYTIWMWQNLPGRNNKKRYQGKQLRNWWDVHGDFDRIMGKHEHLWLEN